MFTGGTIWLLTHGHVAQVVGFVLLVLGQMIYGEMLKAGDLLLGGFQA